MIAMDLETTGTDPATAQIWQASFVVEGHQPWTFLCNPGVDIPEQVAELCHLDTAKLQAIRDAMPFEYYAPDVAALIHLQPLLTFNGLRFDVPILAEELERAGVEYAFGPIVDASVIFRIQHPRNLAAAVRAYLDEPAFDGAHDAETDAVATLRIWQRQREAFEQPFTSHEAASLCSYGRRYADPFGKLEWVDGRMCFAFGSAKGKAIEHDIGYAKWMLRQEFIPRSTKRIVREELQRIGAIQREETAIAAGVEW